ncbi:hypothetical protein V865_004471 [Kwoniella europaea PYCC6329]|uniref:C2H2-type domain-containing protein n=1 Tax=Kwoniella europaea PYCC6329 TaxID=1423913 RepID=A0AAX4KIR5_9TREE
MAEASTSQSPIQQIQQLQQPQQQQQQQLSPQTAHISPQPPTPLHPFQCTVCLRRFTRHENLKRHAHRHRKPEEEVKYACNHCNKVFARSDLRRRHIRKQHPEFAPSPLPSQRSNSQSNINGNVNTDISPISTTHNNVPLPSTDGDDHQGDVRQPNHSFNFALGQIDTSFVPTTSRQNERAVLESGSDMSKGYQVPPSFDIESLLTSRLSEATANAAMSGMNLSGLSPDFTYDRLHSTVGPRTSPPSSFITEIFLSQSTIENGISLYFDKIAGFFPFVHQPTFEIATTPEYLLMAMLCVSLQFTQSQPNPTSPTEAVEESGYKLAKYCFYRSCRLLDSVEQNEDDSRGGLKLFMIQAYLLLEVHALCFARGSESSWGLRFHHRLTELARVGGLGDPYPPQQVDKGDLNALWRQFVKAESHKRTLYAAYHLDTLWYHTLSVPRGISHLEIKLDLPCPEAAWTVNSAAEWAFYGLVNEQMQNPTRYLNAIRICLAPEAAEKVSGLDTYGCLALILYLISGVREMSGWSTVTGKVPIERFEALYASLVAFESIVQKQDDDSPLFILMKATWHMAMIDLLLWSPSHTNGVVEINLEAALAAVARLSNSAITFSSSSVAATVDHHLRWFLTYLDKTQDVTKEAPWMAIYSFKAVLIAYQQVSSGNNDPLDTLGLSNSDDMLEWIRGIFEKRPYWSVGKIVLDSLGELDHDN